MSRTTERGSAKISLTGGADIGEELRPWLRPAAGLRPDGEVLFSGWGLLRDWIKSVSADLRLISTPQQP